MTPEDKAAWKEVWKDRVIVNRVPAIDGWTDLHFVCGHEVSIITAIGEGAPSPCLECISEMSKKLFKQPEK